LTRAEAAHELGISYRTLTRTLERDPTFPRFVALTPGVQVIARVDLEEWVAAKFVRDRAAAVLAQHRGSPK
jgi:predicted DNA-binding transcriptional regulator AlpA